MYFAFSNLSFDSIRLFHLIFHLIKVDPTRAGESKYFQFRSRAISGIFKADDWPLLAAEAKSKLYETAVDRDRSQPCPCDIPIVALHDATLCWL
jgi:hypothetical protein